MVTIHIKKVRKIKHFWRKNYYATIDHQNGNQLMHSAPQVNLRDLEQMLTNLKRDLPKAEFVYDFLEPTGPIQSV